MDRTPKEQFIVVVVISISCCFFLWKLYCNRHKYSKPVITSFAIGALLLTISSIYAYIKPASWLTRTIDNTTMLQACVFGYIAFDQLLNKRRLKEVAWKSILFKQAIIVSAITAVINIFQLDNMGLFADGDSYYPTPIYYVSHFLQYGATAWFVRRSQQPVIESLDNTADPPARLRRYILLYAHSVAIYGICLVVGLNLLFSMLVGDALRVWLNSVYQLSYALAFVLVVTGLSISRTRLSWLTRYIERRNTGLLQFLLDELNKITTHRVRGKLSDSSLSIVELQVQINDKMRVIWTNTPKNSPAISPEGDAICIFDLIQRGAVFENAGELTPPDITSKNNQLHYIYVARLLRGLYENRNTPYGRRYDAEHNKAAKTAISSGK